MNLRPAFSSIVFGFVGAAIFTSGRSLVLPRAEASGPQVLSATAFNLVDAAGRLRGQLALSREGSPGLWLMDDKGVARISIGVYPDSTGYIGLQDKQGQMIELMRSFGPKEAPLLIFKNQGQDMMITGLNPGSDVVPFLMSYENGRSRKIHFGKYEGP